MTKTHTVRGDMGMDGSATTSVTERTRSQVSRAFVNRSANEANAQSELFEQLLNLSFTVQPPPDKQPQLPDSTIAKNSSTQGDKKDSTNVDDEKDDEPTVAVCTFNQAAPLIADKPVELTPDQSVAQTQADDSPLNSVDLVSTDVNQQPTVTQAVAGDPDQFTVQADEQVVVENTSADDQTVATTTTDTPVNLVNSTPATREPSGDSSNKKVATRATKAEDAVTQHPQKLPEKNEKEPHEGVVSKAHDEKTVEPKSTSRPQEDRDDRRGDRREKWFEQKDGANEATPFERPKDTNGANPAQGNASPSSAQPTDTSSQPLTPAAPAAAETTIAPPVAIPATLSIVPQTTIGSTPTSTATSPATSTSSPEPTAAASSTPTRAVGSQTAKTNSKEKAPEPGLSQQERVRVIQRIARSFNRISADGGSINLRLHPEHLGSVSVQVRLEGRSLSARLSTETAAARDAILQDLPALRQRLADQGFDVTKFQVDVAGNGADASFAQSGGQSQSGQSDNRSSGPQTDYRRAAVVRESRAATARQLPPTPNTQWQASAGIDLQA